MANASDIVRVGIIGCGGIANGKHMPSLKKVPGVQMVAFCDIIEERAQKAKKDYGTPDAAVYTDYKKLLEDKTIDVVHVLTPNRAHSFITVDALEAGKHVMCEKPMAINSEEAKKMLDAAEKSGKLLTIGYQTRQTAQAQYLKAESEMGTFGDIYFARACAVRRRAVPTWGVFLNEYEQGGGPLIDIGTHALDVTLWIMNNYKPKYCVGTTYHAHNNDTEQGNDWGNWDPAKFTVESSAFGFIVMETALQSPSTLLGLSIPSNLVKLAAWYAVQRQAEICSAAAFTSTVSVRTDSIPSHPASMQAAQLSMKAFPTMTPQVRKLISGFRLFAAKRLSPQFFPNRLTQLPEFSKVSTPPLRPATSSSSNLNKNSEKAESFSSYFFVEDTL